MIKRIECFSLNHLIHHTLSLVFLFLLNPSRLLGYQLCLSCCEHIAWLRWFLRFSYLSKRNHFQFWSIQKKKNLVKYVKEHKSLICTTPFIYTLEFLTEIFQHEHALSSKPDSTSLTTKTTTMIMTTGFDEFSLYV